MSTETTILDEGLYENPAEYITSNLASTGQRLGNYLIDVIVLYALMFLILVLVEPTEGGSQEISTLSNILILILSPLYYIIAEGAGGQTIGKMVTRTKVVNKEGGKPKLMSIVGRTLSRLVPFEVFSAFSSSKRMWHDSWSDTYVIKKR